MPRNNSLFFPKFETTAASFAQSLASTRALEVYDCGTLVHCLTPFILPSPLHWYTLYLTISKTSRCSTRQPRIVVIIVILWKFVNSQSQFASLTPQEKATERHTRLIFKHVCTKSRHNIVGVKNNLPMSAELRSEIDARFRRFS